jgi:hypothetical protein
MQLIAPEAGPYLDPASAQRDWPSRAAALSEQSDAVAILEREYGSWPRLAVGSAATILLCLAAVSLGLAIGLVISEDLSTGETALLLAGGVVLGATFGAAGRRLGSRVVRDGRSVVEALIRWHHLPASIDADGSFIPPEHRRRQDAISSADKRRIDTRDAILARTYVFRGPLLVRITVSGLLLVAVLMTWGMSISGFALAEESFDYAAATIVGALASILTGALAYVLGGAYRVNAAHARRDPVSGAIFRRFRRIFSS